MLILAIHTGGHDATAVLATDHDLLAAVQLERLTRVKGDGNRFPDEAVDEALAIAGASRSDVDVLLLSRMSYPAVYYTHWTLPKRVEYALRHALGRDRRKDLAGEQLKSGIADPAAIFDGRRFAADRGFRPGIRVGFYNHHLAHALSVLFYTDWEDALLYTADGGGDNVNYSARVLKDGGLAELYGGEDELLRPGRVDSLGLAYGYATQALGFRINRHEGKLTGLAAFGTPDLADEIGRHFTVDEGGRIDSDFASDRAMREEIFRLAQDVEPAVVAASIQQVLEDRVLESVRRLLERHRVRRLGLAGGVFANVRLNRLLCEQTGVDEIFVFPGMGDEGIPVGGIHQYLIGRDGLAPWLDRRRRLDDVYLGRDYDGVADEAFAAEDGVVRVAGAPAPVAAALLADGWIGAIYKGRMEFGPRALGARSILASAADRAVNDSLNARLLRTEFMPFAPCVLEEDARAVFGVDGSNAYAARFMTITTAVRREFRERIPAVVHIDGMARPQTVRRADNPLYADILTAYKACTALPVLVNTSFNVHEEPIVNRPEEALQALRDGRIDFLVTDGGVHALEVTAAQMTPGAPPESGVTFARLR